LQREGLGFSVLLLVVSQDGVPDAIHSLLLARIRVWVITGDKQETAINIAISCRLITRPDALLICNADTPGGAAVKP
jgi:P-type E1-E2 ATPase